MKNISQIIAHRFTNFASMKATFTIETNTKEQMEILIRFLKEMGVSVSSVANGESENADWAKLSMQEMEKEWSHPANDHWDAFIRKTLKK